MQVWHVRALRHLLSNGDSDARHIIRQYVIIVSFASRTACFVVILPSSPWQEVVGALGISIIGGGVAMADKVLYRNDITVDVNVNNTTPQDAQYASSM